MRHGRVANDAAKSQVNTIQASLLGVLALLLLAVLVGATLSLGGLVFQALLRNPLAEPYILGVSGGSAVGAILGILAGFGFFPGLALSSFAGSLVVLSGHPMLRPPRGVW